LTISIYYVNQPYWYFEGGIEVNGKNEIILKRGRHRTIGANALRAMFSKLTFKIFIPKQFNLSRIKYECPML